MKKKKLYLGFLFLILLPILVINNSTKVAANSDDLDYYISKYLVELEIKGDDINAKISISYFVENGLKKDGFKRFELPEGINDAKIKESTIKVYDELGLKLDWDYDEFKGKDKHNYKEISWEHPGFTANMTITIRFLMKDWIVEHDGYSTIDLRNFGTFKVEVKKAEYQIIFPEDYDLDDYEIDTEEYHKEKITKEDGRQVLKIRQNNGYGISEDLSITCEPNITNKEPKGDFILLIAFIVVLAIIGVVISLAILAHKKGWSLGGSGGGSGCGGCGGGCGGCGGGCGGCGG